MSRPTSRPLRAGGRATSGDGGRIVWSVAEGGRGRRWRESCERDGTLVRALLLEVTPGGRPTRLEVTTGAGLLTLHPDPDEGELHGNVVTPLGVRHLRFDWSPDHELLVLGSPACAAVSLGRLAAALAVGETRSVPMLRIDDALEPRLVDWSVTHAASATWRLRSTSGDEELEVTVDDDGLVVPSEAERWPLELV